MSQETTGQTPAPTPDKPPKGNKPVVVYIMILFIAAFLLMALSFFMHQRSNTEALGQIQSSVSAMQEVQAAQEKIIDLQDQLAAAEEELAQVSEDYAKELQTEKEEKEKFYAASEAMELLYCLQQEFSAKNYDSCQKIIDTMEAKNCASLLPNDVSAQGRITPPSERYQELKAAVAEKLD